MKVDVFEKKAVEKVVVELTEREAHMLTALLGRTEYGAFTPLYEALNNKVGNPLQSKLESPGVIRFNG